MLQRLRPAVLTLLALTACQSPAFNPQQRQPGLQAQSQLTRTDLLSHVDGEGDMLRLGAPEFRQASVKENLSQSTQGELTLSAGQSQGRFVSAVLKAPYAFDAMMPAWNSNGNVQLQIRTSLDGQSWSGWLPVMPERTMLLPRQAAFVQVQAVLSSGAAAPRLEGLSLQFGRNRSTRPTQKRAHSIPKPAILSRAAWKATPPKGEYTPHTPAAIVVHHTWMPKAAQYQKDVSIRGIQRYHMVDNKWSDIGYHYIIGPEGVIYQGRPETVVGAHSTPNTNYIGICVFGDFDPGQDAFTPASRAALLDLMTWLTAEYGIQTSEFFGHRDFSTKSCPGDGIYNQLQSFKDEVTRRLRAAGIIS